MTSVEPRSQDDDTADDQDDAAGGQHDDDGDRSGQEEGEGRSKGAKGDRGARVKNAHIIEEFINVGVANDVAFDQWTQYDDWSDIFKKESAQKADDSGETIAVRAKIGPSSREWRAEVVKVVPGRRIEWQAKGGVQAKGVVTFHDLDEHLTHLQAVVQYRPSGFMETIGNFFRMPRRRVRKDLRLFKNFIELRGEATGEGPKEGTGEGLKGAVDEQLGKAQGGGEDGGGEEDRDQQGGDEDRDREGGEDRQQGEDRDGGRPDDERRDDQG